MALSLFVPIWFEARLLTSLPEAVGLDDQVIICADTGRTRIRLDELDVFGAEAVVVVPDRDVALELQADDVAVMHGDQQSHETVEAANRSRARAAVADVDDEAEASIVLAATQGTSEVTPRILTFLEDPAFGSTPARRVRTGCSRHGRSSVARSRTR